jgi:glycosyltransferase involved in cell wall biosynthesis
MRLLLVSGAFPPMASGEATNTYYLAKHIAQRGIDVHVLTTANRGVSAPDWAAVHPVIRSWSWRDMFRIAGILRRVRPDAILLMYLGGIYNFHPMITFLPALARLCVPGVTFVTRFENVFSPSNPAAAPLHSRIVRKLMRWLTGRRASHYNFGVLLRDSNHLITLCGYHRQILRNEAGDGGPGISVIPPPPNIAITRDPEGRLRMDGRRRLQLTDEAFVVGYLGYVYPFKGVDTLLRGFAQFARSNASARLVVLGGAVQVPSLDPASEGYFERMQALAGELGIRDRVTWYGSFNALDATLSSLVHAMDVFVLPFDKGVRLNNSSYSSLVSCGVPVVATRGDDIDRELVDAEGVILVPPRDPDRLTAVLEQLSQEPARLNQLRACSDRIAAEHFSWDLAIDRTLKLLGAAPVTRVPERLQAVEER